MSSSNCCFLTCIQISQEADQVVLYSHLLQNFLQFLVIHTVLNIHWKDWCWSWSSNTLATWCKELTHWKRPWSWERLKTGGEGDDRGWDGWMASLTRWTWAWASSSSWWWTGKPGMLQSMGSQKSDMTEQLNWTEAIVLCYLQTMNILFILQSEFLLFPFLLWIPKLELPELCWIIVMRVGTIVLFLILQEILSAFHHWE